MDLKHLYNRANADGLKMGAYDIDDVIINAYSLMTLVLYTLFA